MAQIGYIESLLGNVDNLPTKLAIRRVAEELLQRIAVLEAATGVVPDVPGGPVGDIAHDAIADADALSVFGRAGATPGPMAPIVAATDGHVLRRTGSSLAFSALPAGNLGDVVGPAGATADAVALFNSTTGKLIKNSPFVANPAAVLLSFGGLVGAVPALRANAAILETVLGNQAAYADFRCANLMPVGLVQPNGFIYPGRADTPGTPQGSWYLGSHGSYGLYTNTGFYVAGAIHGVPWTAYTPTWTSTGTAPAIGNGSLTGRYMIYGGICFARIRLVAGSTTTFGTGQWQFGLPLAFGGPGGGQPLPGLGTDSSTGSVYLATGRLDNAARFSANYHPVAAATAAWSGSTPYVWAINDVLDWQFFYEIA